MKDFNKFEERLTILWSLSNLLYSSPNCICGGPLHILLDDGNVRDSDIEFCRKEASKEEWRYIKELCFCILDILKTLSPAQRRYWWEHRSVDDIVSVAGKNIELTQNGYEIKE